MEIIEHPQTNPTEPSSTDLLLSLPPELLLAIFSYIVVNNFRQDVRRLVVCKKWYAYARPILLSSLCLRTQWLFGGFPMLRALRGGATLAAAQQLTKHIELTLEAGCGRAEPEHLPFSTVSDLEELASKLKDFTALRTLVIRQENLKWKLSIIPIRILPSFISLHQLTSLELDLGNVAFDPIPPHLCESLSQLIPNLKRLRCRLPRICNDLLGSPPGHLKELIISISSTKESRPDPRHCSWRYPGQFNYNNLRTSMETGLRQFAASMRDPKIVRLIYNLWFDDRNTYAFDAIENRRRFLETPTAWDAGGVLQPEDWKESEESEENGQSNAELSENENVSEYEEYSEDEEFLEDGNLPEDEE